MNRAEQKERISEIIDSFQKVIDSYRERENEYEEIKKQYDEMYTRLEDEGYSEILELDVDEFTNKLASSMLSDQTEIEELKSLLNDFQTDLNDFMDEISESRRDKLEERFQDLNDIVDTVEFSDDDMGYYDILDQLEEKIELIKEMK